MSKLPQPPQNINPLWMIFAFLSFTEIVLGIAVFNTDGGVQIALTCFTILFPVLVMVGFFGLLWFRPEHLYSPKDYTNDNAFLQGIKGAREARLGIEGLDEKIQAQIFTVLSSEQLVTQIAQLEGEQLQQALLEAAGNISNEIKETAFFTVSLKQFLPDAKEMVLPIDGFSDFKDLTDEIYFALADVITPFTYGSFWVLQDRESGQIFKHARTIANFASGYPVDDTRSLAEVGISAGMYLEAISLRPTPQTVAGAKKE